ncbi:MAG: NAD(P)-binding protein [Candidatus Izimaplasma sp.]|nr:NAD(P)-binding protein [Candidatus Izimaplasma bacterium]
MEKYDVVIIGGGLGSLTTATYLTKRLRNIAVFEQNSEHKIASYANSFRDKQRHKFEFKYFHQDLGGVHQGDLFYEYLKRCGIEKEFDYIDNRQTMVVTADRRIIKRPNTFKELKIYLVRHFPKQRDDTYRLFEDIERHYYDFRKQKLARLSNQEYTISSLMIEWGDLSLFDVLSNYYSNNKIMDEFLLVHNSVGLSLSEINAYNYFVKWFDTFMDGNHLIASSFEDIVTKLTKEISKSRQKIFKNRKIETVVVTNNNIDYIIDTEGNEIKAKHYVINMRIDEFVDMYLENDEAIKEEFFKLYPDIESTRYTNRVYLGLSQPASVYGMTDLQYLFSDIPNDNVRFLSMTNYKLLDPSCCTDDRSAVMIEYIDSGKSKKEQMNDVVEQFLKYYPKAKDHIVLKRIDQKTPYFGSQATNDFWSGKTLNDLFFIDDYSAINPFQNSYFIGYWTKPESGITGILQTGVEYGDIIDENIYHGKDDNYFVTHEELMNIITNQFIPGSLGKEEKNIQFFIGKDSFFVRTKGKNQRLYKGTSEISDIIIVATNECLYDLSVGNTTLDQAIENGTLEYVGNREFLNNVIEAFDMGIVISKPDRYKYIPGKWGLKIMLVQLSIIFLSNLLGNYHLYIYLAPLTLLAFGATVYYKYKLLGKITVFEYLVMGIYGLLSITSIFIPELNYLKDSTYTLIFFTGYFLATWLFNVPIALGYVRHDYRIDYTRTKLFIKMTGGLTFIWGVTFLVILIATLLINQSYAALFYYVVPLSLYLSFYYPSNYIRGYFD